MTWNGRAIGLLIVIFLWFRPQGVPPSAAA